MAFEKINQSDYEGKGVTGLPDTPGLTTLAMQQKFDELFKDVALPKFNALVEELKSENACSDIGIPEDVGGMANPSKKLLPLLAQVAAAIALLNGASHGHTNKSLLDTFNEEMVRAWETAALVLSGISGTETEISGNKDKIPTSAAIASYVQQMGGGDMARAMYDKDQSGIVDNAERLGGQLPGYYQPAEDPNLHTVAKTITDAINEVAAKEVDVLDTREEIEANTEPGKVAGALAVRGLYNNLGGLSFYEDENGKYVVGADAVPKKLGSFTTIEHAITSLATSKWHEFALEDEPKIIYIYKNKGDSSRYVFRFADIKNKSVIVSANATASGASISFPADFSSLYTENGVGGGSCSVRIYEGKIGVKVESAAYLPSASAPLTVVYIL